MKEKIVMVLAPGFEEAEAVVTADVLRRLEFDLVLAGLNGLEAVGAHGIRLLADAQLKNLRAADFGAVVLPGGMPGAMNLRNSDELMEFTGAVYAAGGVAAAICAAPIALARFGLTAGKTITAYPGFEHYLEGNVPTGRPTERDGRIVTGKGPGAAFEFGGRIAEALGKRAAVAKLFTGMFVKG
ncbi:MAG: DJ-1/PfpI family protein [Victivallaceae bacterium]|nr:DJ-1/PfpI family protein [Victivallaceae bacterium]